MTTRPMQPSLAAAWDRDNGECQWQRMGLPGIACRNAQRSVYDDDAKGWTSRTDRNSVHHIVPIRENGTDELSNLVVLCLVHHIGLHATRGLWGRARRKGMAA
jgi:5-methylcytosine-specific restriction endonuclease McrA